jgi:hypothetical protein
MMIITVPASIINSLSLVLHYSFSKPAAVVTAILQHLCQVFTIFPITTLCLCYFNLTESKDGTSLLDKINKMGTATHDTDLPPEQY